MKSLDRRDSYKIWFDLIIITVAHILLFPLWLGLWLFIPILIYLGDQGPVFYKQNRMGKNRKIFQVIKFRTMIVNADVKGPAWTSKDDPRITRIGKILRKTALDELPELLCILKGEMSLVGPRALDVEEQISLEKNIPRFSDRLQVPPGLTGYAQIYDKLDVAKDKLRYDLEYINRMCVWIDLWILFLSVKNTIFSRWDQREGKD